MDIKIYDTDGELVIQVGFKKSGEQDNASSQFLIAFLKSVRDEDVVFVDGVPEPTPISPQSHAPVGPAALQNMWITSDLLDRCAHELHIRRSTLGSSVEFLALATLLAQDSLNSKSRVVFPAELLLIELRDNSLNYPNYTMTAASLVWFMEQRIARQQLIQLRGVRYGSKSDANLEELANLLAQKTKPEIDERRFDLGGV